MGDVVWARRREVERSFTLHPQPILVGGFRSLYQSVSLDHPPYCSCCFHVVSQSGVCPELQWGSESRGVSMTYVHMQAFFHSFNSQHSLTVVYCLYFFPHNTLNSFYWYLYPVNLKGKPNSAWDQTNIIWSYDTSFFKSSERNCTDTTTIFSTEEIKQLVHTKVQPPTGRRANHCLG